MIITPCRLKLPKHLQRSVEQGCYAQRGIVHTLLQGVSLANNFGLITPIVYRLAAAMVTLTGLLRPQHRGAGLQEATFVHQPGILNGSRTEPGLATHGYNTSKSTTSGCLENCFQQPIGQRVPWCCRSRRTNMLQHGTPAPAATCKGVCPSSS